jgi:hypothetical protein
LAFPSDAAQARIGDAVAKTEVLFSEKAVRRHGVEHLDGADAVANHAVPVDEVSNLLPLFGIGVFGAGKQRQHAVQLLPWSAPAPVLGRALSVVAQAAGAVRLVHALLERQAETAERARWHAQSL